MSHQVKNVESEFGCVCIGQSVIWSAQDGESVYEVTIRTAEQRGSSLSEPLCGVFLCLIGGSEDQGSLHWISPLDADDARRFLQGAVDVISLQCPDLGTLTGQTTRED